MQGGGLSGLFSMATSMMEKVGYKPPPGMKPPTEGEINNVINSVFNNQATQNVITNMFQSLQGCTDFGSAIQNVVKNIADPATLGAIHDTVVSSAANPSGAPNPFVVQSEQSSESKVVFDPSYEDSLI